MSVRNTVKSIQDLMRQDTGVGGDVQRLSQLCWMFFLKIIDDQDTVANNHGDLNELLARLDEAEQRTAALRDQLKAILAEALLR